LLPVLAVQDLPPDFPKDVWLQLLKCCAKSPKCRPLLIQQYGQLKQQLLLAEQQLHQLRLDMQHYQGGGRNSMVEMQLQDAQLRQQAAWVEVTIRDLATAVTLVSSASVVDLFTGFGWSYQPAC
jgi:hypothetical protein